MAFVHYKMKPTEGINSTPTLILGSEYQGMIHGLIVLNQSTEPLLISAYHMREEIPDGEEEPVPITRAFLLNQRVEPNDTRNFAGLIEKMVFEAGDTFYAYSDAYENTFNAFVSYEEFVQ